MTVPTLARVSPSGAEIFPGDHLDPAPCPSAPCPSAPCPGTRRASLMARLRGERGATTAEYAITTLAACGFAAVLVILLKSGEVRSLLMGIITAALSLGS